MSLLSVFTVRVLKSAVAIIPIAIGGLLVAIGSPQLADPENIVIAGIGGVLVVVGLYQLYEAMFTDLRSD